MRICLQCDSEYIDDTPQCRSCGAQTVTPEQAALQRSLRDRIATEKLIEVHRLEGPVDQAILTQLLAEEGVGFAVHGGSAGGSLPGVDTGVSAGFGAILVLEDDVETARRVVRHYQESVIIDHGDEFGDDSDDAADPVS
ncbi:MAG: hypothetical protein GXP62_01245 [Oligoflexia bacterium]|nr:hypothetical protein [Oligoflexia bacterium]